MNPVMTFSGQPGLTVKYTSTDASQALTRIANCVGALITLETQPIRFGFGITPTNDAGTALGHVLDSGESIKLMSGKEVGDFRFVSKVGAAHGVLHVTQYTEEG